MPSSDMTHPTPDIHAEAEELLPWYATGQLDAADRSRVETHLSVCARCQRQLRIERRMVDELRAIAPDLHMGWSRLRSRIETPARSRRNWITKAAADFTHLITRPAVAALAAVQVAILAFAAVIVASPNQPTFKALGSPDASSSANVIVLFRPETTEADMRDALKASGASLVGGPTSADAYLLHVPSKARPLALATLQADDDVTMAEPIDRPIP